MATRQLLAELLAAYTQRTGTVVHMQSVGGVDAARRVQAGEVLDVVCLARDALGTLAQAGRVLADSVLDVARSGVAVAVQAGAGLPDLSSRAAFEQTVLQARMVAYSTGPSGVALLKLFEAWGILPALQGRLLQAPAGVPVGSLVAQGQASLGLQQHSELIHVPGITVAGPLPPEIQIHTVFSAAVATSSPHPEAARALVLDLCSPQANAAKRRQGMEPI